MSFHITEDQQLLEALNQRAIDIDEREQGGHYASYTVEQAFTVVWHVEPEWLVEQKILVGWSVDDDIFAEKRAEWIEATEEEEPFVLTDEPGKITKLTGPRSVSHPGDTPRSAQARVDVQQHHHRTHIVGQHLYGSHEREHCAEAHGLSEAALQGMSDSAVNTWHAQQRHAAVSLVETFGLSAIDAERLLRFAASAAEEGILDDDAAWKCGFDTNREPDANTVVDLARRAAAYIKEHGL